MKPGPYLIIMDDWNNLVKNRFLINADFFFDSGLVLHHDHPHSLLHLWEDCWEQMGGVFRSSSSRVYRRVSSLNFHVGLISLRDNSVVELNVTLLVFTVMLSTLWVWRDTAVAGCFWLTWISLRSCWIMHRWRNEELLVKLKMKIPLNLIFSKTWS